MVNVHEDVTIACKYGTDSNSLTNNGTIDSENNTCTINNLNPNTEYYYSLSVTADDKTYETTPKRVKTRGFNGTYVAAGSNDTYMGIVYLDPTNLNSECTASNSVSTTETKSGCMKWYVYSNNGTDAKMILDHNTTARIEFSDTSLSGTASTSLMKNEIEARFQADANGWQVNTSNTSKIKEVSVITANEIATIVGKENWDSTSFDDYFYFDTGTTDSSTSFTSTNRSTYSWLYNNTYQCADASGTDYGCTQEDNATIYIAQKKNSNETFSGSGSAGEFYGYWTCTNIGNSNYVWLIARSGLIGRSYNTNKNYGIRPVITVPSTWLE